MNNYASDIAFTPAVKAIQTDKGSRQAYANVEQGRGWHTKVTPELKSFLSELDMFYLGTANSQGQPYIQYRGGAPGFLKVIDEQTLGFADFGGNRQYITLGNLSENPRAFIFLIDYVNSRRIKVWGNAKVVENDPQLMRRLQDDDYPGASRASDLVIDRGMGHKLSPAHPQTISRTILSVIPVTNSSAAMTETRPIGRVQYDNRGRVVIVTGGSSGIGAAIVEAFDASGATVVCADVREASQRPSGVVFRRCDTSSEADCRNTAQWVVEQYGAVDVLVNNAAIQPAESYGPIDEITTEVWDCMVGVNLSGYMFMAKHVLRQMKRQQSGVIVNIASGQAHRTARHVGVYGPIKSANVMQARQWGIEYARDGIRVISISPGAIDTPLVRATLEKQGGGEALANRHPLGRIGKPHEVAAAALWLSSADASFVTATDLEVDGGLGGFGAFADPYPMDEE